ncbi:hypothetical protein P9112_012546 [Eukaryota sp. TZLM1-RC]
MKHSSSSASYPDLYEEYHSLRNSLDTLKEDFDTGVNQIIKDFEVKDAELIQSYQDRLQHQSSLISKVLHNDPIRLKESTAALKQTLEQKLETVRQSNAEKQAQVLRELELLFNNEKDSLVSRMEMLEGTLPDLKASSPPPSLSINFPSSPAHSSPTPTSSTQSTEPTKPMIEEDPPQKIVPAKPPPVFKTSFKKEVKGSQHDDVTLASVPTENPVPLTPPRIQRKPNQKRKLELRNSILKEKRESTATKSKQEEDIPNTVENEEIDVEKDDCGQESIDVMKSLYDVEQELVTGINSINQSINQIAHNADLPLSPKVEKQRLLTGLNFARLPLTSVIETALKVATNVCFFDFEFEHDESGFGELLRVLGWFRDYCRPSLLRQKGLDQSKLIAARRATYAERYNLEVSPTSGISISIQDLVDKPYQKCQVEEQKEAFERMADDVLFGLPKTSLCHSREFLNFVYKNEIQEAQRTVITKSKLIEEHLNICRGLETEFMTVNDEYSQLLNRKLEQKEAEEEISLDEVKKLLISNRRKKKQKKK